MSKLARRNQARQLRLQHQEKKEVESSIFQGPNGTAKNVAMIPLSRDAHVLNAIRALNQSVEVSDSASETLPLRVKIDRFRRNLLYLSSKLDLLSALDICQIADWVVLVLSPGQIFGDFEDQLLRAIGAQGISNVMAVVQGLEAAVVAPKRPRHLIELRNALNRYFPSVEKVYNLDSKSDSSNLIRTFCTASTKGIRWRDDRNWMFIEDVRWLPTEELSSVTDVKFTGVIRGKGLNVDRLVHVPSWGDFRIRRVFEVPTQSQKRKVEEMYVEVNPREWLPSPDQEDLDELAPDVGMDDGAPVTTPSQRKGVLLDDHHYFPENQPEEFPSPKKLPQGTSSYQAAWYLDDVSDSGSDLIDAAEDMDDVEMEEVKMPRPEDGVFLNPLDKMTDIEPSEYPMSEVHVDVDDEDEARQLAEYRESRKKEAQEDLEFPDEVELHPDVLARERLAKYRGLKNLRTSEWNTEEDSPYEPVDYKRLLEIADYKKSRNTAMREALAGGIPVGTRVEVQLRDVPLQFREMPSPQSIFGLLRHEHKHVVVNLNATLSSAAEQPIKSKEEVIIQIGPRRLTAHPVFSAAGVTANDVHKFNRFLHAGQSAFTSFIGPLTWGSVPTLIFQRVPLSDDVAQSGTDGMEDPKPGNSFSTIRLIGTATTAPPSQSRVIAKRLILTGHPYKIHKKVVTVRYMFFNREDVAWFAALPLWTKRGRQGFIKEPLGTHGYFKATFDGRIYPMDAVGVSLYKRVWPRTSRPWLGLENQV